MPRNQHDLDPTSFKALYGSAKDGYEMGQGCLGVILAAPRLVFGLVSLAVIASASWGAPLVRGEIGPRVALGHGLVGLFFFYMIFDLFKDGPLSVPLQLWGAALAFAMVCHLLAGVKRLVAPGRRHVHGAHVGIPLPPLQALWNLIFRSWANYPPRVAMLGEPMIFLLIAMIFAMVEGAAASAGQEFTPGAAWIPLLTASGIFLQSIIISLRDLGRQSQLADQEQDQIDLAEGLMRRPARPLHRDAEGIAQPPRRSR